ncbi:farnesyltransferase beta subunit [Leishmania mexicana MHOM/GT/2001/U1103]|uniref:Farnesyltransferase beta subunit n=1 Tax=Leishmania mexicana (strain MHOM/GT/2001/U1103) TaxID=929439 RepID=E9AYC6_LEIMU|nr:farnesyltransferase beta subunit [Leishmania mexicana MHOM/GT/2001/U1103]CBZ27967.1 farnesyltransferase beta subunit [Leishmania mexicana MHOM/GT/2001/U1103]
MNLAPDTITIEAQRNTELLLLEYLRSTNPHIYALWQRHPDKDKDASSSSAASSSDTRSAGGSDDGGANASSGSAVSTLTEPFNYAEPRFHRAAHVHFLMENLSVTPQGFSSLYPSRPWIVYWALQAADVLSAMESEVLHRTPPSAIVAFLHSCLCIDHTCQAEVNNRLPAATKSASEAQEVKDTHVTGTLLRSSADATSATLMPPVEDAAEVAEGPSRPVMGFAGGATHQEPHIASSYAACCALAMLSWYDDGAPLRQLPRAAIKRWLLTLRNEDGSFRVHGGGESDIRASYCAAVITTLLGLDDPTTFDGEAGRREFVDDVRDVLVLTLQTARFVAACQTHEGGFTCSPTASEAHGAYTQCGLAALLLMKQPHMVHQASLRRWLAARQLNCEGGFNGRTNKLVDSCYSHWIGASHVLLRTVEAYTKCFAEVPLTHAGNGDATGAGEKGGREDVDSASPARCLRAREVVLLDHAQLLDAEMIHASSNDAWDRAESEHLTQLDVVDQFLGVDDAVLRSAEGKRAAVAALYEGLLESHLAAARGCDGNGDAAAGDVQGSLEAWRARQAFLYADVGDFYFNQRKLQDYVLRCCQDSEIGGLMDKPRTAHDGYHTCYSLSGLSAAQNLQYRTHATAANAAYPSTYLERAFARSYLPGRESGNTSGNEEGSCGVVLSLPSTSAAAESMLLRTTNPIFNIHQSRVLSALRTWSVKAFV